MDTQKHKELLVAWLRDAYAMEKGLEHVLKAHAESAKDYPLLQEKLHQHLEVTQTQAERIKERLESMGEDTSTLKTMTGEVMGMMQGHTTLMAKDKVIKNALADFATEYFEIACYDAIKVMAEKIEDHETVSLAQTNIEEEQEMADWAEENLPTLLDEFCSKEM